MSNEPADAVATVSGLEALVIEFEEQDARRAAGLRAGEAPSGLEALVIEFEEQDSRRAAGLRAGEAPKGFYRPKVSGDEAERLEELVIEFEEHLKLRGADEAERSRFATLAINLRSLGKLIDKRFALRLYAGVPCSEEPKP